MQGPDFHAMPTFIEVMHLLLLGEPDRISAARATEMPRRASIGLASP